MSLIYTFNAGEGTSGLAQSVRARALSHAAVVRFPSFALFLRKSFKTILLLKVSIFEIHFLFSKSKSEDIIRSLLPKAVKDSSFRLLVSFDFTCHLRRGYSPHTPTSFLKSRFVNTNKIMTKILPGPAQYFAWNVDGKYHIFSEIYFHLGTFVMNTISQLFEFIFGLGTSLTNIRELKTLRSRQNFAFNNFFTGHPTTLIYWSLISQRFYWLKYVKQYYLIKFQSG